MCGYLWNDIRGERKPFPVEVLDRDTNEVITCKNTDELVDLVTRKYDDIYEINEKVRLKDVLWILSIGDGGKVPTSQLCDNRTKDIIEWFIYLESDPSKRFDGPPPKLWFDSVNILRSIFRPKGLF